MPISVYLDVYKPLIAINRKLKISQGQTSLGLTGSDVNFFCFKWNTLYIFMNFNRTLIQEHSVKM